MIKIKAFINFKFGNKLLISKKELSCNISYHIPFYKKNTLNDINGFFGLIGPDFQGNKITNLFDVFNKNGVIQGVFIVNGTISFVRKYVNTDKLKYEEINGEIPMNHFTFLLFELFNSVNLLPNIFGLANTAFLHFNNQLYALNERDLPYKINLNFVNKTIDTERKLKLPLNHFLAHSKIKNNILETIDYSSIFPILNIITFNKAFQIIKKIQIKKIYTSMIHDFISLKNHYLFIDCPLFIRYHKNITFKLNKNEKSKIFIIDKTKGNKTIIDIPNTFIFHYGKTIESKETIQFEACLYDDFDFNSPDKNYGKFRKVIIDKHSYNVTILKNEIFENFSLDFPVIYKNYTLLMNSNNFKNAQIIVTKDFKLYKIIDFHKNINGEASVVEINEKPYIICFTYDGKNNFLTIQGIENEDHISILIPFNISIGFHSIFIPNK